MSKTDTAEFFWEVAMPLLAAGEAEKGTMMGFPCLRVNGDFFASAHKDSGDLIVKLPASEVDRMIADGLGEAFMPNGRRFKEWVSISDRDAKRWYQLMVDARKFVLGKQS